MAHVRAADGLGGGVPLAEGRAGAPPIYDSKAERSAGRRFVTVLAYQVVQVIRRRLRDRGETAVFRREDDSSLHVSEATYTGHCPPHAIRRGPGRSLVPAWERHFRVEADGLGPGPQRWSGTWRNLRFRRCRTQCRGPRAW